MIWESEIYIDKIHTVPYYKSGDNPSKKRNHYPGTLYSYELIYNLKGKSSVFFNGETFYETTDTLRYLPKGVPDCEYYVDTIEPGECIDIYFDSSVPVCKEAFCIDCSSNAALKRQFLLIYNLWEKKEQNYYYQCMSVLYSILAEINNMLTSASPLKYKSKIEPAVKYIHEHYCDKDFPYNALPGMCKMGYTYFKKLFDVCYKTTPSKYILNLRLQRACELLVTGRFSVTEVAEMTGFENIYYFSRVFKKHMGTTPSEFGKQ